MVLVLRYSIENRSSFNHFEKGSPQPQSKDTRRVHLTIRFNLRSVLINFQSLTEKPVLWCAFVHPMILIFHIWLKTVWIASL